MATRVSRLGRLRTQVREQDHLANRRLIGEEHDEAVDADAFTRRRRHAVFESADVVLVEPLRLLVAARPLLLLLLETLPLLRRIVELGIGVRKLATSDEELEAIDEPWVVALALGKRRRLHGKVRDEPRLHERRLDVFLEDVLPELVRLAGRLDVCDAAAHQ